MMTLDQLFGLEKDNPHDHVRAARLWLEKEPSRSILTWEDLVSKFINEFFPPSRTTNLRNEISNFQQWFNESFHEVWDQYKDLLRACPHHGFIELHQLDTFYNALNPVDQDSLNSVAGGNLLERRTQDVLTIVENKSKIAKLTHAVNQQTSVMTTAMTAILKQFQATPPPAFVKAVEEICVTFGGAHPYYQCLTANDNTFSKHRDNIQGYVSASAVNYNQGNSGYHPPGVTNQIRPSGFGQSNVQIVPLSELEKIKKMNEINMKAMQTQISNVKNELRNEMKNSIQASMSNQTNELKNMMASFFQMNIASTLGSGPLPRNTIANPKGELKVITTRSGIVLDGPSIPMPHPFINPEEEECVEETLTDHDPTEYTIKGPPPLVQKSKPPSQRNFMEHQRDPLYPNISYPSRMHKQKQQEKDEKMLKALPSNKEKLLELANTPLNENCSAVILKKLPEKLRDPGKFLILCGFSELKCKALANLGASINLMPLLVWKKLGLPELISTRMTLELANRAICTPAGIARDVFVPVSKFTFPAYFVVVDYESNPRVPFILERPFLRTARALIDFHGKEMILCNGDERLTLNMRHDTSSYSNQPQKESINMINIYDDLCEDFLENLFATNHLSGNPTFSFHTNLTLPEVKDDIFDPEGDMVLIEKFINLDSTKDLLPPHNINPSSGSTTSSSPNHLLEEFADELALITFLPKNNDLPFDIESDLKKIQYLLNHDPIKDMDSIIKDSIDKDNLVDNIPEMFTDEHALDYSSPPLYDDDLFEHESDNDDAYNDPFDSKGEKIKESKLLIDELDLPISSSFFRDNVFSPGILIHENLFEVNTRVAPDKNLKKIAISHASLILEDFDPPLSDYELPFHKVVPCPETLLSFSSENEKKVFKPEILTSKGDHFSLLPELSHRGPQSFQTH
nr:hypothetical protein [Tanacetum cinerariifolium]